MGAPVDSRVRSCLFHLLGEYHTKFCKMACDADSIIKICDIYDWDGKGQLDMYYFMDVFYALGFNITKKICDKYGQNDNGTIMWAELENFLSNMGDMVPKEDTMKLLDLIGGEEDEDGFIQYKPFLDKLCASVPM